MKLFLYFFKFLKICLWFALIIGSSLGIILSALAIVIVPNLPTPDYLKEVQLQTPLKIYTKDSKLIAEFGEKRRQPLTFEQIPKHFISAILAAEDRNFFEHSGVDLRGLARATVELVRSGEKKSGGSTITMQVARNFFLTREQTFIRKFNEIFLSLKIERAISKEKIMELYVNKIYLGHRSYGIAAAAKVYYGRELDELTLAELAMIAGLPKAPSSYNPITNPSRALIRRNWILGRMATLGYITAEKRDQAQEEPITARFHGLKSEVRAPYIAEMVRKKVFELFGSEAYTNGLVVRTTVTAKNQLAASAGVQKGILEYEERHGYRGPENTIELDPNSISDDPTEASTQIMTLLADYNAIGPLEPAVVLSVVDKVARIGLKNGEEAVLDFEEMSWAKRFETVNKTGKKPKSAKDVVAVGDIIRVREVERTIENEKKEDKKAKEGESKKDPKVASVIKKWRLTHTPEAQAALISLNPKDGAIEAIVGGFDFYHSKFNRALQAGRQAGSSFKPFVYAAALANGYTAASLINDAPIVLDDPSLETHWRPENSSGQFYGPTRLRQALYKSRNLVSIRLLRRLKVFTVLNYVTRYGFDKSKLPANLSLALGSASLSPMQIATGYTVFANGGYRVLPYFISSIEDAEGNVLFKANPYIVCEDCERPLPGDQAEKPPQQMLIRPEDDIGIARVAPRVEDERLIYIIRNMMQDVIRKGTGRRARELGRKDIAGKTGTTNDQVDAWFAGYNGDLVATAWLGFDTPASLGAREYGAKAALPIWMHYMGEALAGKPEFVYPKPPNLVSIKIDPDTGLAAHPSLPGSMTEYFRIENAPELEAGRHPPKARKDAPDESDGIVPLDSLEQLF